MIGVLVGLEAEAVIARRFGCPVAVGGGGFAGACDAVRRLVAGGAGFLLSFGLAGGLRPGLEPGAVLVPAWVVTPDGARHPTDAALASRFGPAAGTIFAGREVIAAAAAKAAAWRAAQADAIDLETAAILEAAPGRRFAVLRAVCDPAERDLPPAALAALQADGRIGIGAVLWSVARNPGQIGGLIALGREAATARKALSDRVRAIGPLTNFSEGP